MPIRLDHVMHLLSTLAQEENLRVAVKESLKGGLLTGMVAAAGGLLGGPPGLAVGGAVGGALAAWSSAGRFKSVATIILEMDHTQQLQLYNAVWSILEGITADDLVTLQALVRGDAMMRRMLLDALVGYVQKDMGMTILD
ncbi:protein C19orf12 homolog [Branchiostoma floridae]|uniref:Protein C19orf12 homolog n=1 Tax=Branchiostoma floridae TaxID=7739 RepID=A0A9J7MVS1_BRAFL|nr:protein C19orf12 homolog [Branchiostoma floridae]XP_035680435.1 protein C19orf12 homolog [Branchiostoma floridae]